MPEQTPSESPFEQWVDLSEAARILGVHFTTLRRWADTGKIPHIRTPGGRRRFARSELENFLRNLDQAPSTTQTTALAKTPAQIQPSTQSSAHPLERSSWTDLMDEEQRSKMRSSGQRLLALLMQYNCRSDPGESFLDECRQMGQEYGRICYQANMSMVDTINAFQYFRRSVLESVHETSFLNGENDSASQRIFQRTIHFLDTFLLEIVASYTNLQQ
jgi:excisionase family DNA binding protein